MLEKTEFDPVEPWPVLEPVPPPPTVTVIETPAETAKPVAVL
jgi:hypothetical protein